MSESSSLYIKPPSDGCDQIWPAIELILSWMEGRELSLGLPARLAHVGNDLRLRLRSRCRWGYLPDDGRSRWLLWNCLASRGAIHIDLDFGRGALNRNCDLAVTILFLIGRGRWCYAPPFGKIGLVLIEKLVGRANSHCIPGV